MIETSAFVYLFLATTLEEQTLTLRNNPGVINLLFSFCQSNVTEKRAKTSGTYVKLKVSLINIFPK